MGSENQSHSSVTSPVVGLAESMANIGSSIKFRKPRSGFLPVDITTEL